MVGDLRRIAETVASELTGNRLVIPGSVFPPGDIRCIELTHCKHLLGTFAATNYSYKDK